MIRWGLRRATPDAPLELVEPNSGGLLSAADLELVRADAWWFDALVGDQPIVTAG